MMARIINGGNTVRLRHRHVPSQARGCAVDEAGAPKHVIARLSGALAAAFTDAGILKAARFKGG